MISSNEKKFFDLLKGITYWELILFIPTIFIFNYLPLNNWWDIIINVVIFGLSITGLFAITAFLKSLFKIK
ncbi:DUF6007 family protein [Priestia megaterium]|uniref:DUF6007 family protein n=1 Tax=Priestia megaterium TaxID=1404 RepID=UPI002FFF4350